MENLALTIFMAKWLIIIITLVLASIGVTYAGVKIAERRFEREYNRQLRKARLEREKAEWRREMANIL